MSDMHVCKVNGLVKGMREALEEAYRIGFKDGQENEREEATTREEFIKAAEFEKALCIGWECGKKVHQMSPEQRMQILGPTCGYDTFNEISASEAYVKITEWEEGKKSDDEIKVGDEVIVGPGLAQISSGIVTSVPTIDCKKYCIMWQDGSVGEWEKSDLTKTGNHYNIQSILDQMKK